MQSSTQDVNFFKEGDHNSLRSGLSNLLGRPFGPINITELSFRSAELQSLVAKVVCEHSFNDKNLDEFDRYSVERWSIINMALENIFLKERSHEIAKQWARTFNEMKDPIIIIDQNYKMILSNKDYHKEYYKTCYQVFAKRESPCLDCQILKTFEVNERQ